MKNEKRIILIIYILLSGYVIYTVSRYPSVPGTLGPAFFPRLTAIILGGLSAVELVLDLMGKAKAGGEEGKAQGISRILIVLAMLIAVTLCMQYVNAWIGIAVFLFVYICLLAKEKWLKSLIISAAGTGVVYLMAQMLRIHL